MTRPTATSEIPPGDVDVVVRAVRSGLREKADPARASGQQAYMKSAMPFLGVSVPDAREVGRSASAAAQADILLAAARTLWEEATHREERYAAMALLGSRPLRGDLRLLPIVEHMVRTGQWWDITDELAHRLGDLLDAHPVDVARVVHGWSRDEDLWIRRIAILAQLGRKARVDPDLLTAAIEPNAADRDFFIRKAIGWALRDYARTDPHWVRRFVDTHDLSPLSIREALKHL